MDAPGGSDEYASCEWVEGGLAFNRRSLHACLVVHHDSGMPFLADYNGGVLSIRDVLRLREEIRLGNRQGRVNPACSGCAHLRVQRWPTSDYLINIIGIAHYSHCNIECNYCFLQTQDPASFAAGFRPYSLLETLRELLDAGTLAPNSIIDWGGGEPTVYREFDAILAMTLDQGAFHYLHTNGVKFTEIVRNHPHAGNLHVICSVDAGFPETYLRMKKRDFLEQVWRNLADYIDCGCQVTIKYIVREDNCAAEELEAFVARAVAIGAKDLITDIDYDYPDPGPQIIAALAKLKHLATLHGLNVRYGFAGENFNTQDSIEARVDLAFKAEQVSHLSEVLRNLNFHVGENVAGNTETLIKNLFEHCAEKDAQIIRDAEGLDALRGVLREKDQQIIRGWEDIRWLKEQCDVKDAQIVRDADELDVLRGVLKEKDQEIVRGWEDVRWLKEQRDRKDDHVSNGDSDLRGLVEYLRAPLRNLRAKASIVRGRRLRQG